MSHAKLGRFDHFTISHCLRSKSLECGCLLGVYATYGNRIIEVIDARGERCRAEGHQRGHLLDSGCWQPATA